MVIVLIGWIAGLRDSSSWLGVAAFQKVDKWKMDMIASMRLSRRPPHAKGEPFRFNSSSPQVVRKAGLSMAEAPKSSGGVDEYMVLNIEFKSAAARMAFRQRGATVFTAVDRFIAKLQKQTFKPASAEGAKTFLTDAEKPRPSEKGVRARVRLVTREDDNNVFFETQDDSQKGAWVHRNYIKKN